MLVSMNWIKDFVDLSGIDLDNLIRRFTLSTAEVEEIYHKGADTYGVIVARILSVENHPNSKKLHLLKVDTGKGIVDCVCGAPNVRENMLVAFATDGGCVCGNKITKASVAGYISEGMCCSEQELGISDEHSGIIDIDDTVAVVGMNIKELYQIDDTVFEVDNKSLTNRPDLWGHYGIAREFSVLTGRELKQPKLADCSLYGSLPEVPVDICDTEHCYRYSSLKVANVTKKISPVNIRIRLFYCGMRAINLIADLTNYLMLELGQPMHAFDMRKVSKVEVKRFDKSFMFKTLDGIERLIDENTLMICSDNKPVAVAGIMGGLESEIENDTTSFLLESANFDGISVRKSSARMMLRTDASARYEKILDPELTETAIRRFLKILIDIDRGVKVVSSFTDRYVRRFDKIHLTFDKSYVDRYTGINISCEEIENTLKLLGFSVSGNGDNFEVDVPSWRATKDVTIKADIIEEITRIYGYDNFEIKTSKGRLFPTRRSKSGMLEYKVRDILVKKFNMHEIHSYIWCDRDKLKELSLPVEDNPKIINALSPNNDTLRNSMIPTLLTIVNENKGFSDGFSIFEIGSVIEGLDNSGMCTEKKKLGMVFFSRTRYEEESYYYAKGVAETLAKCVSHSKLSFANIKPCHTWQHPKNTAEILADGNKIGFITPLHPEVKNKIDKKAQIVCVEIDINEFSKVKYGRIVYEEPSRYPGIDIDITLLTNSNKYETIEKQAEKLGCEFLRDIEFMGIYGEGKDRSITVRLKFCSDERTLSMEEIQPAVDEFVKNLSDVGINMK